jgi:Fe-S-cluster containining protein
VVQRHVNESVRVPSLKPDPSAWDSQLEFQVTRAARQCLAENSGYVKDREEVARTLSDLVKLAEQFVEGVKTQNPPASPIVCRSGCSHCCYYRVHITPLEVLCLLQHIRTRFSDLELTALRHRVEEADGVTRGMSDEERGRAQIACPLLVDNRCAAYEARPLECRGYASTNVDACRQAFFDYDAWNVPLYLPRYSFFKSIQAGIGAAAIDAGRPFEILELTAALRIALEDPTAVSRWLAGENSFQAAALPPTDPEYLAFQPWTPTL